MRTPYTTIVAYNAYGYNWLRDSRHTSARVGRGRRRATTPPRQALLALLPLPPVVAIHRDLVAVALVRRPEAALVEDAHGLFAAGEVRLPPARFEMPPERLVFVLLLRARAVALSLRLVLLLGLVLLLFGPGGLRLTLGPLLLALTFALLTSRGGTGGSLRCQVQVFVETHLVSFLFIGLDSRPARRLHLHLLVYY